jgi:antitoxin ParD1/3/4
VADRCLVCGIRRSSKIAAAWNNCDRRDAGEGNVAGVRGRLGWRKDSCGDCRYSKFEYDKVIPLIWEFGLINKIEKRTFSLPVEHADFIDQKVSSGSYASASEVVRAGLRALQERDAAMERWLNKEVAETYDAMKADPARRIPAEEVFAELSRSSGRKLSEREDDKRLVEIIKSRADEVGVPVNLDDL